MSKMVTIEKFLQFFFNGQSEVAFRIYCLWLFALTRQKKREAWVLLKEIFLPFLAERKLLRAKWWSFRYQNNGNSFCRIQSKKWTFNCYLSAQNKMITKKSLRLTEKEIDITVSWLCLDILSMYSNCISDCILQNSFCTDLAHFSGNFRKLKNVKKAKTLF